MNIFIKLKISFEIIKEWKISFGIVKELRIFNFIYLHYIEHKFFSLNMSLEGITTLDEMLQKKATKAQKCDSDI